MQRKLVTRSILAMMCICVALTVQDSRHAERTPSVEPDPGPLPTEEPPIVVPPIPPSGPVGPG
jgi:hypothetical protein